MNRIQFIKQALLSVSGFFIAKSIFEQSDIGSKIVEDELSIKLLSCNVAGFQYYDGPDIEQQIKQNDRLTLVPEIDNMYDNNAIAVYWKSKKLGFIPRHENEIIANLLQSEKKVSAVLRHINPEQSPWHRLWIRVVMA